MYNTSPNIVQDVREDILSEFNADMYRSGHAFKYRISIINTVMEKYENKVRESGGKLKYRNKFQMLQDKLQKPKSKFEWYKVRGYATILNVPVTPNSQLKKNISRRLVQQALGDDFKVLVREVPGQQAQHLITNVTQFNKTEFCGRRSCLPCQGSGRGAWGKCWSKNPTYKIKCGTCEDEDKVTTYIGESGYSAYFRAGLHRKTLVAESHRSVLWQHMVDQHGARPGDGKNMEDKYKMQVTGSHQSSVRRLIAEGILIDEEFKKRDEPCRERRREERPDTVLNSKAEWHQPAIRRLKVKPYFDH